MWLYENCKKTNRNFSVKQETDLPGLVGVSIKSPSIQAQNCTHSTLQLICLDKKDDVYNGSFKNFFDGCCPCKCIYCTCVLVIVQLPALRSICPLWRVSLKCQWYSRNVYKEHMVSKVNIDLHPGSPLCFCFSLSLLLLFYFIFQSRNSYTLLIFPPVWPKLL